MSPSQKTIAFIVADKLEENAFAASFRFLLGACEKQGVTPIVIPVSQLVTSTNPRFPVISHGTKPVYADAVFWAVSGGPILAATAQIEAAGIPCMNSASSVQATNKAVTEAYAPGFASSHFPRTVYVSGTSTALAWAESLGYPVILKHARGKGGTAVYVANNEAEAQAALNALKPEDSGVLISDFEDCGVFTRRAFVIGGQAIALASQTTIIPGQPRNGEYTPVPLAVADRLMMEQFAAASKHGCIAFDYGIVQRASGKPNCPQPGSTIVFEANSNGAFEGFTNATRYNVAAAIVSLLVAKARHWRHGGRGNPPDWKLPSIADQDPLPLPGAA